VKLSISLCFIYFLLLNYQTNGQDKVVLVKCDTIFTGTTVIFETNLKLHNKELKLQNEFLFKHDCAGLFDLQKYQGLSIYFDKNKCNKYINFDNSLCARASWNIFSVFKGDSIDNPEGYHFKYLKDHEDEIYILSGYFYGCNGNSCNYGAVLVLFFTKEGLSKAAVFGIDKSTVNFDKVIAEIKNRRLILSYNTKSYRFHKVDLYFDDQIRIISNFKSMIKNGLCCMQ
jgi:hypothetical protein